MSQSQNLPAGSHPELSRFRLVTHLGGRTWRARRLGHEDMVAVKLLPREEGGGGLTEMHERVFVARELDHPNIARVRDVVEDSGFLVVVSDFVDGEPLGRALQRNVRMTPGSVLALLDATGSGLETASARHMVHGALHPNEIILAADGPRVTAVGMGERLSAEFGGAESDGRFPPHVYAAPEVLSGSQADERSDIFSLGALAFHMLTGHPPYPARTASELALARAEGELHWPRGAEQSIPVDLIFLVEEMCSIPPEKRPRSYRDLRSRIALMRRGIAPRRAPAGAAAQAAVRELAPADEILPLPAGRAEAPAAGAARRHVAASAVALASVAAFVLVLCMGLRQFTGGQAPQDGRAAPGQAGPAPAQVAEGAREAVPPPAAAGEAAAKSPEEFYRKRFLDCQALLAENPEASGPVVKALEELSANREASPWDLRAKMLLDDLARKEGNEGRSAYEQASRRAVPLEASLRFGEALAAWREFPEVFRGTSWHVKVTDEISRIEGAIPRKYAEIDSRARTYLARGELDAARSEYLRVVDNFGTQEWVSKARGEIEKIATVEERLTSERDALASETRASSLRASAARALGGAYAEAAAFRYDDAIARLEKASAAVGDLPELSARLRRYCGAVRAEKAMFDAVAARYQRGEAAASGVLHDERITFDIRGLDARGLTCVQDSSGRVEMRLGWDRLPASQAYKIFSFGVDRASAGERLGLAVFCFHRGLGAEEESEMTVAARLDPARAAEVEATKADLDAIRTELQGGAGSRPRGQ